MKIVNKCLLKCECCEKLGRKGVPPLGTKETIAELKALRKRTDELLITDQEPFLRADIFEILEAAEQLRFRKKWIYSTGLLFTNNSLAARLPGYTFGIIVPLFGYIAEEHDKHTGVKGSFEKALLGIKNLRKNGIKLRVDYITNDSKSLPEAIASLSQNGISHFIITPGGLDIPAIRRVWAYANERGIQLEFSTHQRELSIMLNNMFTGPIVTQFEITNNCNHRCVFCYHHSPHLLDKKDAYFKTHKLDEDMLKRSKKWHQQRIDFKLLKTYAKEAAELGCTYVQLGGGGEPPTHPDFMRMVRYIKGLGLQLQTFTNFTSQTPGEIRELVRLGIDVLEINVSASTPETYSKIHSVPESIFSKLKENLGIIQKAKARLKTKKPEIRIMNPVCSLNYKEIPDMVNFGIQHDASAVYLGHLQTTPLTDYLLLNKKQIKETNSLIKKAQTIAKKSNIENNFEHYLDVLNFGGTLSGSHTKKIFDEVGCLMPFYETQVHLDGWIAPCCLHPPIFKIGNRSFKEMWNSTEYKDFRKKVLGLYRKKNKQYLCRGCRMCVYQEDIQRFYKELGALTKYLK